MARIIYTSQLAASICERLAAGESLRAICRSPGMPDESTVRLWSREIEEFAPQYARARDEGLDVVAQQCIDIADEPPGRLLTGGTDNGAVAHQRLRFDARRWYLSKLAPKRYGDRLEIDGKMSMDVAARIVAARIVAARKRAGTSG